MCEKWAQIENVEERKTEQMERETKDDGDGGQE